MPDTEDSSERLKRLEARIAAAKGGGDATPHQEEHYSQAQVAWRMVIELVAGLGIGFAVGFGLDAVLGTTPVMMVIFIFLGLAAGVKTMMRTAQEVQQGEGGSPQDGD